MVAKRFCAVLCTAKKTLPALSTAAPLLVQLTGAVFCHSSAPVATEKAYMLLVLEPVMTAPPYTSGGVTAYQSGAAADVQIAAPVLASSAYILHTLPTYAEKKTRPLAASTDAAPT